MDRSVSLIKRLIAYTLKEIEKWEESKKYDLKKETNKSRSMARIRYSKDCIWLGLL